MKRLKIVWNKINLCEVWVKFVVSMINANFNLFEKIEFDCGLVFLLLMLLSFIVHMLTSFKLKFLFEQTQYTEKFEIAGQLVTESSI